MPAADHVHSPRETMLVVLPADVTALSGFRRPLTEQDQVHLVRSTRRLYMNPAQGPSAACYANMCAPSMARLAIRSCPDHYVSD